MDAFIKKYRSQIFNFCLRKLPSVVVAEDIAAQSIAKCYKTYVNKGKSEIEIRKLFFTSAKNLIADYYIDLNKWDVSLGFNENLFRIKNKSDEVILIEIEEAYEKRTILLTSLENIIFKVLFSLEADPKSNEEIAYKTGLTVKKVMTAKRTLLRKIRQHLSSKGFKIKPDTPN